MKLLRALAGNDAVKNNILKNEAPKVLDDIINIHKVSSEMRQAIAHPLHFAHILFFSSVFQPMQANESFSRAALHCLSTLTLRSTENSQALFEIGAAETIVETMKLHPSSRIVQVCCVWVSLGN